MKRPAFDKKRQSLFRRYPALGFDELVTQGVADPERLYLFGHSHGVFLVNMIIASDDRFRAAVAYEAYADPAHMFGLAWGGGGLAAMRKMYGGTPWEVPDRYRAASPISKVDRIRTPVLLIAGEHGIAYAEAVVWLTALRAHGVESELVVYGGEGHVVARPDNAKDMEDRSVAWFKTHA